ncbi:hypothetical protein UlMin_029378 [Ulmus minor]
MIETVWKEIESTGSVTDEELSMIVDQRSIKRIFDQPSEQSLRKEEYACFLENFCACYSFFYDIVNKGEQLCACIIIFFDCFNNCSDQILYFLFYPSSGTVGIEIT